MRVCCRESNVYFYIDELILWSQNDSETDDITKLLIKMEYI